MREGQHRRGVEEEKRRIAAATAAATAREERTRAAERARERQDTLEMADQYYLREDESGKTLDVENRYGFSGIAFIFYALGFMSCGAGSIPETEIPSFEMFASSIICYLIGATITISGHLANINARLGDILIQQYRQTSHARRASFKQASREKER